MTGRKARHRPPAQARLVEMCDAVSKMRGVAAVAGIALWLLVSGPVPVRAEPGLPIRVLALSWNKAILEVDGHRRVLAVGETSPEGVVLIEVGTELAVVEVDGRREVLPLGVVAAPVGQASEAASTVLWADGDGFFHAEGSINGTAVTFLVDTGATTVALSRRAAEQIGLDVDGAPQGVGSTAGGVVRVYRMTLNTVRVGGITLYNVPAGVVEGDFPEVPLLGMSVLNRLEMRRDGRRMELIQKY